MSEVSVRVDVQATIEIHDPNRDRIAKSKSARAQAEKKLREVVEKHAGTWAAGKAKVELAALDATE